MIDRLRLELAAHYVLKAALHAALEDRATIEIDPSQLSDIETSPTALASLNELIIAQQESLTEQNKYLKQKLEANIKHTETLSRKLDFHKFIRTKITEQLASLTAERWRISAMVARGTFPVNRDTELARQELALQARIAEADAALADIEIEKENVRLAAYELTMSRREATISRVEDLIGKIGDAKSRLQEGQRMLERADIRAPHDGYLRNFRIQMSGLSVIAGEPLVEVTMPNQSFLVEATVPAEDLAAIEMGEGAAVRPGPRASMHAPLIPATLDGLMSNELSGVAAGREPQTVYFNIDESQVPARLRNKFRTGYSVSVSVRHPRSPKVAISALDPPASRAQAFLRSLPWLFKGAPAPVSIRVSIVDVAIPKPPAIHIRAALGGAPLRRFAEFFKGSLDSVRIAVEDIIVPKHDAIHIGTQIAGYGFGRRVDDRLLPVETRVQQHRDTGQLGVLLDDAVVTRVGLALDRLDAARAIDVRGRWDERELVRADFRRHCHEGIGVLIFEEFVQALDEDNWRKRAERFAMLDAGVDQVLHRVRRRGREDGTVTERAGPDLGPPLKPPDDSLFA